MNGEWLGVTVIKQESVGCEFSKWQNKTLGANRLG